MGLTIKAVLKPEERKTDKTHLVMLRLTIDRKRSHLGTGIYIPKKDWNPKGSLDKKNWIRSSNDLHEVYNAAIDRKWKEALTLEMEQGLASADELKQKLTGKVVLPSFLAFYEQELERIKQDSTPRTYEKYSNVFERLKKHLNGKDLLFSELTVDFLKGYEKFLLQDNKRNTASKNMSFIRTIIRRAVLENKMAYADNPFLQYKLKLEKPDKARLTQEEMQAIIALDLPEGRRISHARTAFLLQFFMAGMRIGDLLQLRWEMIKDDRVEYKMQKTQKARSIKLMPQALALIEPMRKKKGYVLPFLPEGLTPEDTQKKVESMTALINKHLGTIAEKAKIEKKLTTHVARHSFASMAWTNSRDLKAVSQALGHSSLRMTEMYLRELTTDEEDTLLSQAFSGF